MLFPRLILSTAGIALGCGGTPPPDPPAPAVIVIGQGEKPPPVEVAKDEVIEPIAPVSTRGDETPDACLKKLRDGRGLSADVPASEAGTRYIDALANERAEKLNEARKGYLGILQQFPSSPVVPLVYFAFGELFYAESHSDPMKGSLAEQSYKEVLKYPPPGNTAVAYSYFRLGSLGSEQGKGPEALNMLMKLESLAESSPKAECAQSLLDGSRKLLVTTFANVGQPEKAPDFFLRATGKQNGGKPHAYAMVIQLCELYLRKQKPVEAAAALVNLSTERSAAVVCSDELGIISRVSSSIPAATKAQLLERHHTRCEMP